MITETAFITPPPMPEPPTKLDATRLAIDELDVGLFINIGARRLRDDGIACH